MSARKCSVSMSVKELQKTPHCGLVSVLFSSHDSTISCEVEYTAGLQMRVYESQCLSTMLRKLHAVGDSSLDFLDSSWDWQLFFQRGNVS